MSAHNAQEFAYSARSTKQRRRADQYFAERAMEAIRIITEIKRIPKTKYTIIGAFLSHEHGRTALLISQFIKQIRIVCTTKAAVNQPDRNNRASTREAACLRPLRQLQLYRRRSYDRRLRMRHTANNPSKPKIDRE